MQVRFRLQICTSLTYVVKGGRVMGVPQWAVDRCVKSAAGVRLVHVDEALSV